MVMNQEEMDKRLSSPLNLVNRLRNLDKRESAVEIFTGSLEETRKSKESLPFVPPSIDDLIDDVENKIEVGKSHNGALRVRSKAIGLLEDVLVTETNPVRLAKIARDISAIASDIREESIERKSGNVVPIIFKPMIIEEANLQVIHVND